MHPDQPTPGPEQEATTLATPSQPDDHTPPPTPPSITSSMDELGERLDAKNEGYNPDPLTAEKLAL